MAPGQAVRCGVGPTGSVHRPAFHEAPTLKLRGRIREVDVRLARLDRGAEGVGAVLRPVANVACRRVVPPGDRVVRHAVDDAVAHHRRRERGHHGVGGADEVGSGIFGPSSLPRRARDLMAEPALLAGLWVLLAMLDVLDHHSLADLRRAAFTCFPASKQIGFV